MNTRPQMVRDSLPCLVCGKALERAVPQEQNHPNDAIVCTSHGNYGSGVFDPCDGHYLEVNVCDSCLKKAAAEGKVALGYISTQMGIPLIRWQEDLEDTYPSAAAKARVDKRVEADRMARVPKGFVDASDLEGWLRLPKR